MYLYYFAYRCYWCFYLVTQESYIRYEGYGKSEIKERVEAIADELGIYEKLSSVPSKLSGGECQRTAIARAVIAVPQIIIADEPTSSLDRENRQVVLSQLQKLNETGMTVLLATHDEYVAGNCDQIIHLESGAIQTAKRRCDF